PVRRLKRRGIVATLPVPHGRARRAVLGSLALAAVGTPIALARAAASAGTTAAGKPAAGKAPTLVWSPDPMVDGLNAFEGVEDDRAHSDAKTRHIYVKNGVYHWDMPRQERDTSR